MNDKKKKSGIKKTGAVVLAAVMLANIIGLVSYSHIDHIDHDEAMTHVKDPYVIEETVEMPPETVELILDDDEDKQKQRLRISAWSVFTYIIGCVASLCSTLLLKLLSPLLVKILGWLIFAAAVFAAIAIGLKKAFPDIPLKELLSAKNVGIILLFIAAIITLCECAEYYYRDYIMIFKLAALLCGAIVFACSLKKCARKS